VFGPADVAVTGVAAIEDAQPDQITFIHAAQFARQWNQCRAAAAVISQEVDRTGLDTSTRALIVVPDAELACIKLLEVFAPPQPLPAEGVDPSAVVEAGADIGAGTRIGPLVWVGADARIGRNVVLYPGVRIYPQASIGDGSTLHANVVVRERCSIGRGVIIHQNSSIGADGFGYRPDPSGRGLLKVPQIGTVVIEDGVEIGANSCVDRAKFGVTRIGAGTKIDNIVQIGHNVTLGRCVIVAGATGLAGSVHVGDGALIAGQVGIVDHVNIGKGARIGAGSLVTKDVADGESVVGYPADSSQAALRQWASIRKLPGLIRSLSGRQ
jgi:UDP-3-O-[3-hydroxymyristoyl] glucosamine N-acyltransferase